LTTVLAPYSMPACLASRRRTHSTQAQVRRWITLRIVGGDTAKRAASARVEYSTVAQRRRISRTASGVSRFARFHRRVCPAVAHDSRVAVRAPASVVPRAPDARADRVLAAVDRARPGHTFLAMPAQHQCVPIPRPARIVHGAPTARDGWLVTAVNRAGAVAHALLHTRTTMAHGGPRRDGRNGATDDRWETFHKRYADASHGCRH
jgi:hypothetical protein